MTDIVSRNASEERRLSAARASLREKVSRAYTLVHSRAQMDLARSLSIDDYRELELEQIEGPADPNHRLISHTFRRLSDMERVEEVRQGIVVSIEALRSRQDLVVG